MHVLSEKAGNRLRAKLPVHATPPLVWKSKQGHEIAQPRPLSTRPTPFLVIPSPEGGCQPRAGLVAQGGYNSREGSCWTGKRELLARQEGVAIPGGGVTGPAGGVSSLVGSVDSPAGGVTRPAGGEVTSPKGVTSPGGGLLAYHGWLLAWRTGVGGGQWPSGGCEIRGRGFAS